MDSFDVKKCEEVWKIVRSYNLPWIAARSIEMMALDDTARAHELCQLMTRRLAEGEKRFIQKSKMVDT